MKSLSLRLKFETSTHNCLIVNGIPMFSVPAHALKSQIGNNYSYVIESEEMNKIKEVNSPMLAKVKSKP